MNTENNTGGYDQEGVIWHQHSNRLLKKIMEFFPKEIPVIDLGCGHNFYISAMIYCGWHNASHGLDAVDLGSKYMEVLDITKPIYYTGKYNVISLEVGEHVPSELSDMYLDNICGFGGDIIMSWAVEGQEGIGHVNCHNNNWVISEMHKRGYKLEGNRTADLRASVADCHCSWFKETLMYFIPAYL